MKSRVLVSLGALAALIAITLAPVAVPAAEVQHRLIIHVDQNDPMTMNIALNNASNATSYYLEKGEEIQIEIVTHGPGLNMLREDTSPVKDRIQSISENFDNIGFRACGNTHRAMSRKAGKDIVLLPQAQIVPSGVTHMLERQEQGWAYVRP